MRGALIVAGVAIACIAGLAIWQLSDDDTDSETEAPEAPVETLDPLPKLPRGWTETVNPAGGFALGAPPGWSTESQVAETTLTAPRSPVVIRVTADRTDEAIEADLGEYAEGIAAGLNPDAKRTPVADPPSPTAP